MHQTKKSEDTHKNVNDLANCIVGAQLQQIGGSSRRLPDILNIPLNAITSYTTIQIFTILSSLKYFKINNLKSMTFEKNMDLIIAFIFYSQTIT